MEKIKLIAKEKGVTLAELAYKCAISPQRMSAIVSDNANPTLDTLSKIATALHVRVKDLLDDDPDEITGFIKYQGELKEILCVEDLESLYNKIRKI